MRNVILFCVGALIFFIAGYTSSQFYLTLTIAPPVNYNVEFNARTSDPKLKTYSSNKNCTKGTGLRKGCVKFIKGSLGTISFSLKNEGGANSLKCGDSGVKWVITRIDASVTGDVSGDENKGTGWGVSLPPWVTNSYSPIKDASQGILYETVVDNGETSVIFLNLNKQLGEKDLWYKLTATNCDDHTKVKESDPRIENDGRN